MTNNKKHILVIDDDAATCDFLRELFEEEGWRVSAALNTAMALAAVQTEQFHLIVSDINLNEQWNGIELLKHFRQIAPQAQVILISGFGTLETAIEAVRGAADWVLFVDADERVTDALAAEVRASGRSGRRLAFSCNEIERAVAKCPDPLIAVCGGACG